MSKDPFTMLIGVKGEMEEERTNWIVFCVENQAKERCGRVEDLGFSVTRV